MAAQKEASQILFTQECYTKQLSSSNNCKIKTMHCFFEPQARFTYSLSETESKEVSNMDTDILNIMLEANFKATDWLSSIKVWNRASPLVVTYCWEQNSSRAVTVSLSAELLLTAFWVKQRTIFKPD